ncbi:tyrosine-type recombinase/integrase [Labrenzia sp. R4_2]|uniref:tyrosine-type recombinase/integrase n=1 Tax=Labrenzia sp. R4_2 TaxID=2821107 RepID=UPI001ADD59B1|nr:tyrosine-type recombinase/integrase [Labrenzia sp. R4_2]MBO9422363.1 tyrosine-type recombinase/integrase [Labrenzia sp. R4_2]
MRQAQTLNDTQLRRVLHYCRSRRHPLRDETIVLVSFMAGLRAKEIAALKISDVYVEKGAVREQFMLAAAQSKGGKTRTVYLNVRLRRALADYAAVLDLGEPLKPLFPSQKGGHFSANTMCQLFLEIYRACGLKDASSHSGRRTYITRLANKGVGVRLLAELAGHCHISTTQRYIDVNADQLKQAVELL